MATPKQIRRRGRFALLTAVIVGALAVAGGAFGYVTSDQPDYSPGSVVTMSGGNDASGLPGYVAGHIVSVDATADNGLWEQTCSATVAADGTWSCQVTLSSDPAIAVGSYTYTATSTDANGNPISETGTFTDNTNKTMTYTAAGTGSGTVTFTLTGGGSNPDTATGGCSVSGPTATCTSSGTFRFQNNTDYLITATPDSGPPASEFANWSDQTVLTCGATTNPCTDTPNGNAAITATFNLVPDATPPIVNVETDSVVPASGWFTSSPQQVDVSAYDPSGVTNIQCSIDAGSYADASGQSGAGTSSGSPRTGTVSVTGDGTHSVVCRATDGASNTGTAAGSTNSITVKIDTTAPSLSLALSESDAFDYVSGSTVYYNPSSGNTGSFTVTATTSDTVSGIDHVAFPTVFGSDSNNDGTSPYASTYSWNDTATASGAKTVTSYNGALLTTTADFTVTPDTTPPSGGSITYADGYYTTASVPITTSNGTDGGSGIDTGSGVIKRAEATLSGGSCGSFGGYTTTVTLSGGADTTVASGHCYEYEYLISDHVSNQTTYTSTSVAMVDTNPPTSAIGFPVDGTSYTVAGYNAGCSTSSGDICGTGADTGGSGLNKEELQIQRASDSEYWNGSNWQASATWVTATGTSAWSYSFSTVGGDTYTVTARATDNAGNVETSPTSATFTVQAATSVLYTGSETLIAPTDGTLSANESSAAGACTGLPISYAFDEAPGEGGTSYGPSASLISFDASNEGVYTVTATVASTPLCVGSSDTATVTVGSAGSKATGGGFISGLPGVGRVNFGFVVDLVTTSTYKGQFVLVEPETWRFKGCFGQACGGVYAKAGTSGSGTGSGTLYHWDSGTGTWVVATNGSNLTFTISFIDNGSGAKGKNKKTTSADQFGIRITYDAAANGYSDVLPNFPLTDLKGGNITVS